MMTMSEKQQMINKLELERDEYVMRMRACIIDILEIHESEKLIVSAKDRLIGQLDDILHHDLDKFKEITNAIKDMESL